MINRRTVVAAGLAGIPVGVGAGLGIRWWMTSDTTLRLLGRDASLVALLDTGNERVLFLLGEPDNAVLDNLPQLMAFGRQRVDMVIASHRWLTSVGLRAHLDLNVIVTLSLQSSASAPPIRGNVHPVVGDQHLGLGEECDIRLAIRGGGDSDTESSGTDPDVIVEIMCDGTKLVLANRAEALVGLDARPHLLAIPGNVAFETIERLDPEMFVGTELHPEIDMPELQVFHNDPVSFTIKDGSVKIRQDQLLS